MNQEPYQSCHKVPTTVPVKVARQVIFLMTFFWHIFVMFSNAMLMEFDLALLSPGLSVIPLRTLDDLLNIVLPLYIA